MAIREFAKELFMTPSDPNPPKTGGLLARLFGLSQAEQRAEKVEPPKDELMPNWDAADVPNSPPDTPPLAIPVKATETVPPLAIPVATPPAPVADAPGSPAPVAEGPAPANEVIAPPQLCPSCQTPRKGKQAFCEDCGWMFPAGDVSIPRALASLSINSPMPAAVPAMIAKRIKERYEITEKIGERAGLSRYKGWDHGSDKRTAIVILEAAIPDIAEELTEEIPVVAVEESADEEILPTFEDTVPAMGLPVAVPRTGGNWPGIGWEKALLEKAQHPSLPAVLDHFVENNCEYLIETCGAGRSLWDAWDEPEANAQVRYGWLKQLAEGLHALHQAGAIIEGIRPDIVTVDSDNQAMLSDLSDLLPLPLPPDPPIRGTLYTAPELVLSPGQADARADLYSFGALIYSLEYLHHALEEKDFEHQYSPKLITDRYPDVHPTFFRLVNKTFVRDLNTRFPTDEASKVDPTGFTELINSLDVCRRSFDNVRLDIAAWTTTGMVRTGNEDAFAFLHGVESRQDDLSEYAMVLLADGMGGYEAGEVAAAMAICEMRKNLLAQPMFAALTGQTPPEGPVDVEAAKRALQGALKHANKEVFTFGRTPGKGKRGMGCTAEAVYVDNQNVIVGHVGDSRTYHLHQGRLIQLTRDQTLVNRLVELGQLTEAEAESHPRKNELQQAIGGQPDVVPGLYHGKLKRGDWVLVCSDGLTNHIPSADLEKMLTREAAGSAEEAARRLLNLVNLRGATDNATIVVVRAM
jgi:protein phosphatase